MEVKKQWMDWLASGDTGVSSETMFSAITGVPVRSHGIPYDIDDIGRCVRMLRRLPDLRPQLSKVIAKHKGWMPFIDCWKEIEELYDECVEYEKLSIEEKKKKKRQKYYLNPLKRSQELMNQLRFVSYYMDGMRIQNRSGHFKNQAPKTY